MNTCRCRRGDAPLVVSIPHAGTGLPERIATDMSAAARTLPDTDWFVDRLYDFVEELDATVVVATQSRYLIDLNRAPDDAPLYPGQAGTGLCPTMTFDGEPIYTGDGPGETETRRRRAEYWQPYHDCIRTELDRLRSHHARVVLWDAHSIRSEVPLLFDGELPVLNLGTYSGRSCGGALSDRLLAVARSRPAFPAVLNGRFTGGYITRTYGDPDGGVHAVQLELAQRSYMRESPPVAFEPGKADEIRPVLRELLAAAIDFATNPGQAGLEG